MSEHPHAAAGLDPKRLSELQEAHRPEATGEIPGPGATPLEYRVYPAFNPDAPRYPKVESHLWGAWPIIAVRRDGEPLVTVETGGYHDLEVQDPYTGRTMWVRAYAGKDTSVYDALRRLIDAMEAASFLSDDE